MQKELDQLKEMYREALEISNKLYEENGEYDERKEGYLGGLRSAIIVCSGPSGGYVEYDRNTPEGRRAEIDKWSTDPWYPVLLRLDFDLAKIDPGYNLTQLKTKFGELRYYAHPNRDDVSMDGFQDLIRKAEQECEELR